MKSYNINFMKYSKFFLLFSISLFILSIASPFINKINFGIDFTGGSVLQIKSNTDLELESVRNILKEKNIESSVIKFGEKNEFLIKLKIDETPEKVFELIKEKNSDIELRKTETIGSKVGGELVEKGLISLVLAILTVLIYISFRFEFKFAIVSIIAIFHDIVIVAGILILFKVEITLDILAGLLTILGYSLNDTIVVIDRIRENLNNNKYNDLSEIINVSINKTLSRTILTSLTTLFVVFSIFVYGGDIIHGLALTLLIGIIIGTYSSIFIASPLLKYFNFDINKWRNKIIEKEKNRIEREKQRKMYELGSV